MTEYHTNINEYVAIFCVGKRHMFWNYYFAYLECKTVYVWLDAH